MNVQLLDCTLRDGGFVNDWNFGKLTMRSIATRLHNAGVDFVEIGFLDERVEYNSDRSVYPTIESIDKTFGDLLPEGTVAMIDFGNFSVERLIPQVDSRIDGIRLIFKKEDLSSALNFARTIKEKGYRLFLNPVSLPSYTTRELLDLIDLINEIRPEAVSMVDTYGIMFHLDLTRYASLFDSHLSRDIALGFHSHNNLQMANANCIEFINMGLNRSIIIDSSLYGMGKNAGNACTELISSYINKSGKKSFDVAQLIEAAYSDISRFLGNIAWGYNLEYLISAIYECSPNWTKYLLGKNTLSVENVIFILEQLPNDKKREVSYFSKQLADEKVMKLFSSSEINDEQFDRLKSTVCDRRIVLICPSRSVTEYRDAIDKYIADNNAVVFTVNYLDVTRSADFAFISNPRRYSQMIGLYPELSVKPKIVLTSNITQTEGFRADFNIEFGRLHHFAQSESSTILLIELLREFGANEISFAGFDGFEHGHGTDDFFYGEMSNSSQFKTNDEVASELLYVNKSKIMSFSWLTPSNIEKSYNVMKTC